jgi:hypothetical protein
MFGKRIRRTLWGKGYIPGDNWLMCDLCGLRYRASQMRQQPHGLHKGLWVCPRDFEDYNPQFEDIRGVAERITPDKTNPDPEFTSDETTITSPITGDDL